MKYVSARSRVRRFPLRSVHGTQWSEKIIEHTMRGRWGDAQIAGRRLDEEHVLAGMQLVQRPLHAMGAGYREL